jgi:hypothetical protein
VSLAHIAPSYEQSWDIVEKIGKLDCPSGQARLVSGSKSNQVIKQSVQLWCDKPVVNPDHVLLSVMLVLESVAAYLTGEAALDSTLVSLMMNQCATGFVGLVATRTCEMVEFRA